MLFFFFLHLCVFPDPASFRASVSEEAPIGRSVVKVRATDQDAGRNAEITYKITSGDDQGKDLCVFERKITQVVRIISYPGKRA